MTDVPDAFRAAASARGSASFDLLHPEVQRWIWHQGWEELRDIQEGAIPILVQSNDDVIIAAGTASGKTEAAFLPIASRIAQAEPSEGQGFRALYVSPLRALINDQFRRMESLCEDLEIPVFRWHGDVAASTKARARRAAAGIVLITPESLEALLVRRGSECRRLFAALQHVVVDELHAFFDVPRGKQLQSLLHRIELAADRRVPRVGLSATLADMLEAARFLRPLDPERVQILRSAQGGQQVKLQIRGHVDARDPENEDRPPARAVIVDHIFESLRGRRGLVFAGSRSNVEQTAVDLSDRSANSGVPNEFFAHHGNLSREIREEAETRMRDETRPASIVCTTTLELGIDIGHIDSVAQIGTGHSVASMRQRLGRSGRRAGRPAVMRIYIREAEVDADSSPLDALRPDLVQAVAMVNLMQRHWLEPPHLGALHFSTLMHQVMALIAQHGGFTARQAYDALVTSGVFRSIDSDLFAELLRRMGHPDVRLLEQASDGTLLLGGMGERLVEDYRFYAVFQTPEEYTVLFRGKRLGTLPVEFPYRPGDLLIFAGRRWRVEEIDDRRRLIAVVPSTGGLPPTFVGSGLGPSEGIIREMRKVYQGADIPDVIDPTARTLLAEGRDAFARFDLKRNDLVQVGNDVLVFPWVGGPAALAVMLALRDRSLQADLMGLAIGIYSATTEAVVDALKKLAGSTAPDGAYLAASFPNREIDKYDSLLSPDLQALNFASRTLEAHRIPEIARALVERADR
jgi:ATP-dependent Lhr-like helicase